MKTGAKNETKLHKSQITKNNLLQINEKLVAGFFLVTVIVYIILYGLTFTKGFIWTEFNIWLFLILIPIFFIDSIKTAIEAFSKKGIYTGAEKIKDITVIIPCYNGSKTLDYVLADLLKRFSAKQIIVSSNGSTDSTIAIAKQYKVRFLDILEPVGKVEAINQALSLIKTKYTLIIDDDVLIGDAILPTSLLDGGGYTGIAFKVYPQITTWLTMVQWYEYRKSMDIGRGFHNSQGTVQNISGAIGLFTTAELIRQIPLHTGEFSGEDLQRTLLIHLKNNSTGVIMCESSVQTEVPDTLNQLFKQRIFGWFPGFYANIGNYLLLLTKPLPFRLKYEAFHGIFLVALIDILRLITLPIIFYYPVIAITFYFTYVLVELVPFIKLKQRPPIWVIAIYPLYGLFGFITRITAFIVFLYRRTVVKLSRRQKLDDYKNVHLNYRIIGIATTQILTIVIFGLGLNFYQPVTKKVSNLSSEINQIDTFTPTETQEITWQNYSFDEQTEQETKVIKHTVATGETMRSIALFYYGNEIDWYKISTVSNPDIIYPGEVLEINNPLFLFTQI